MREICKKCGKHYKSLADGICFHCDKLHWTAYWNKIFTPKK